MATNVPDEIMWYIFIILNAQLNSYISGSCAHGIRRDFLINLSVFHWIWYHVRDHLRSYQLFNTSRIARLL